MDDMKKIEPTLEQMYQLGEFSEALATAKSVIQIKDPSNLTFDDIKFVPNYFNALKILLDRVGKYYIELVKVL